MASMSIAEAAEYFGISKEAIHNRIRRGSLHVTLVDGVKYVEVDTNAPITKTTTTTTRKTVTVNDERYLKLLEEQNLQLQTKVERLEGETRTLRDQKEEMLIQERIKIEQIYKDKDEQLKNFLTTLSSQFMLNAPVLEKKVQEEHLEAEIETVEEVQETKPKGELISLKKYFKKQKFSQKKKEKIKARFQKKAKKDERIILIGGKFYIDSVKFDYSDLIK